jgi:integrase
MRVFDTGGAGFIGAVVQLTGLDIDPDDPAPALPKTGRALVKTWPRMGDSSRPADLPGVDLPKMHPHKLRHAFVATMLDVSGSCACRLIFL